MTSDGSTKPVFKVDKETLKGIAQSLQEGRKMARSLDNIASALLPLTDSRQVKNSLRDIQAEAELAARHLTTLYNQIAPAAFKP